MGALSRVAELILKNRKCVALTGAGISVGSGIPPFRTADGLWQKYDPAVYASIEVFRRDPSKYWSIRGEFIRKYDQYQPNAAHLALVQLEEMGLLSSIITQNIDGLHKKSGSQSVIEIHGSLREITCLSCGKGYLAPAIPSGDPPVCSCGGVLKPNTVLFGERLPEGALLNAQREAAQCRIMLLIGTSAVVMPAAALPELAKQQGAIVVEINPENAFPNADISLLGKAEIVLPRLTRIIQTLIF
jgi:NAD-dependent deacetylase